MEIEKESLITIKYALTFAIHNMKTIGKENDQIKEDMSYELKRINEILRG